MSSSRAIAAAQTLPIRADIAANLSEHVRLIALAAARPAARAGLARAMALIVGAPVRLAERLYIGAFTVSADGSLDLYTKQCLGAFPPEVNPDGAAAQASP